MMTDARFAYRGRVAVFFVVDPSETVRREAEPCKQQIIYGSAVSEGSTAKKTGQRKSQNRGMSNRCPPNSRFHELFLRSFFYIVGCRSGLGLEYLFLCQGCLCLDAGIPVERQRRRAVRRSVGFYADAECGEAGHHDLV